MTRLLRHLLLILTLFGLAGQATAVAMAPAQPMAWTDPAPTMAGMDCMTGASASKPSDAPCKSMTWQCIVAMGCASAAIVEPAAPVAILPRTSTIPPAPARVASLSSRSYAPEPDPPSRLI